VNQQPSAQHKGRMVGGHETLFPMGSSSVASYSGYLRCYHYYLPSKKHSSPYTLVLAGARAGSSLWVGSYADGSYWILKNINWTCNQYPGGTGIWIKFSVWFLVVWFPVVPTTGAGFMENLKDQPPIRTGIWIWFSIWFPTVPTTGSGFSQEIQNHT